MKKVSCVIAAYNEAPRIDGVLNALRAHPLIDEVIVVNDGSADDTSAHVKRHEHVTLIELPENHGKSFAVTTGIRNAKNEIICLIDADLIGLSAEAITALILPVISGNADVTISLRKNSLLIMRCIGIDYVSGERAFHRSLIEPHLSEISQLPSFAIESFFNDLIIKGRARIKVVRWPQVETPRKSKKSGFISGFVGDIRMIRQIIRHVGLLGIVRQNREMLRLRISEKDE